MSKTDNHISNVTRNVSGCKFNIKSDKNKNIKKRKTSLNKTEVLKTKDV